MKKIAFALIISLISSLLLTSHAGNYKYIAIESGSTIRLDTTEMKIIIDEHSVIAASNCNQKKEYQCLVSEGGAFVFPRGRISEKMTWEFNGQEFRVVRKVQGQLFGDKYSGFIVQSHKGDDHYWYLLSPPDGLLAFGATGKSNTSTFILEGRCGFAATNCYER